MRKGLMDIFERLLAAYGHRHWWPAESPFEVMVGAILTQNTAWSNVEKAIANLAAAQALTPAVLATLPIAELEELVRPSGYFRQKAHRLQLFAQMLMNRHGGSLTRLFDAPLEKIRAELLAEKGIGFETADSILLYAGHLPSFVVDAYTMRIFSRLGFLAGGEKYQDVRALFMTHLPHDSGLFNEYHALLVEQGKTRCRKRNPLCDGCPLAEACSWFKRPA